MRVRKQLFDRLSSALVLPLPRAHGCADALAPPGRECALRARPPAPSGPGCADALAPPGRECALRARPLAPSAPGCADALAPPGFARAHVRRSAGLVPASEHAVRAAFATPKAAQRRAARSLRTARRCLIGRVASSCSPCGRRGTGARHAATPRKRRPHERRRPTTRTTKTAAQGAAASGQAMVPDTRGGQCSGSRRGPTGSAIRRASRS
jgi:hypothetical protein